MPRITNIRIPLPHSYFQFMHLKLTRLTAQQPVPLCHSLCHTEQALSHYCDTVIGLIIISREKACPLRIAKCARRQIYIQFITLPLRVP